MDNGLKPGTVIHTFFGEEWVIKKLIGSGGQGSVYLVENGRSQKALKWYWPRAVNRTFYEHIKKSVVDGAPAKAFIWPQDTTEYTGNTFGYIMDLRPDGYYDMTDFLLTNVRFVSFRRAVDAAMNIVFNMRILHIKGYCYQDLNDGNFFISPQTGKVLICDNDNVAPNGVSTGVFGKPRYMAPEIVLRKSMPNIYSDRFSLALIIFRLLTLNHPLEGKRAVGKTLTPEKQKKLYGDQPLFMFDPEDDRNKPDPAEHKNAVFVWRCLPGFMKDIFIRAFGKTGLEHPNMRPTEAEWIDALVRFRSSILKCDCGNEVFVDEMKPVCDECGKEIDVPFRIKLPEYTMPAGFDSRIYRCQTCITDADRTLDPVARVIRAQNDEKKLGIKNMSAEEWTAVTTKGKKRIVPPRGVIPLKDGICFESNGTTLYIEKNR